MKRIGLAFLFLFFFSTNLMAGPLERLYSEADAQKTIELDEDSVAVIVLPSNPSTGHGWRIKGESDKHLQILGSAFESSRPDLLGAPGKERIYVAGAAKGQAQAVFEYRRPHETMAPRSLIFNFNVRAKLKEAFHLPSPQPPATAPETTQLSATLGLPASYNWCSQNGGCPPVRDQGQCGGCWAFATQGPLECLIKAKDEVTVNLSEQYLISCNAEGWGCEGGFWAHDYNMTKKVSGELEAGAPYESTMPYQARDTACNPPHAKAYQISSWAYVCGNNQCMPTIGQLKQAIFDHGPLAVAVCVDSAFQNYRGGVFTGALRGCYTPNHAVLLVGWDDNYNCWIMRNSWGSGWGESGYMRIRYGTSQIGTAASYVVYPGGGTSSSSSSSSGGCNTNSSNSSSSSSSSSSSGGCN